MRFSTPYHLGYDPSIRLLHENAEEAQYEVVISSATEERVYRTISLLSNTNIDSILGRGTRVWKSHRIENGVEIGEPVALKDSWVDASEGREGTTYANILASATDSKKLETLKKYLLTVVTHGDVFIGDVLDQTRLPPTTSNSLREHKGPVTPGSLIARQIHYRIVYEEVCESSLHSSSSLRHIFKALGDACICK